MQHPRPRCRDLGICPGVLKTGEKNAITDVPGVRVGHVTLRHGSVCTGVTAILSCDDPWMKNLPAATFVLNGNGEMTGLAYLNDMGLLESPILLTNTLNVPRVADATISWILNRHPRVGIDEDVPIPVVAECDDSTLNDIRGRHVNAEHVLTALEQSHSGPVEEGGVGAGTGMIAYQLKGGIGTSSRHLECGAHLGALVLTNMGLREELTVLGVPLGRALEESRIERKTQGSLIIVLACDAPLSGLQLSRLARRAALGLARTGAISHHGSGDIVLAFSTANAIERGQEPGPALRISDRQLDPLYQAAVESTEEAILNSMLRAHTTVGRDGNTAMALPIDTLVRMLSAQGAKSP